MRQSNQMNFSEIYENLEDESFRKKLTKEKFIQKNKSLLSQNLKEKDVLRILRNLCVEEENQIELKEQNILKNLVDLLMEEELTEEILIFQVIGNSILNCKENQIYLKELKFYDFTLKKIQSSKRVLLSIITMILSNSREVFNFQNDFDSLDFLIDQLYNKKKESDSATKWMYFNNGFNSLVAFFLKNWKI
jgi:hypothetical protein